MKDIQSIKMEVKEGIYPRRVIYMEIRGQGSIPLTRTDENFTRQEIEQKATKLACSSVRGVTEMSTIE